MNAAIRECRCTKRENTAQCWRSKKRGRWTSDNSIAWYEKSGRLAQIQSDLNRSQVTYVEATDLALEELIFGRHESRTFYDPLWWWSPLPESFFEWSCGPCSPETRSANRFLEPSTLAQKHCKWWNPQLYDVCAIHRLECCAQLQPTHSFPCSALGNSKNHSFYVTFRPGLSWHRIPYHANSDQISAPMSAFQCTVGRIQKNFFAGWHHSCRNSQRCAMCTKWLSCFWY